MLFMEAAVGDVTYVPAGWMVCECTACNELIFGYRVSGIIPEEEQVKNLQMLVQLFAKEKQTTEPMEAMIRTAKIFMPKVCALFEKQSRHACFTVQTFNLFACLAFVNIVFVCLFICKQQLIMCFTIEAKVSELSTQLHPILPGGRISSCRRCLQRGGSCQGAEEEGS
jgi:hypothetical protein